MPLSYFYLLPLLDLYLLFPRISSQESVQQAIWTVPNGQEPDFSNTFTVGNTIPISWNQDGNGTVEENNALDLWVTTFDYSVHQYSQLLEGMFFPVRFVSWVKSNHNLQKTSPSIKVGAGHGQSTYQQASCKSMQNMFSASSLLAAHVLTTI